MKATRALVLLAGALFASTASYAFEATQFVDPPSTLSRAEVKAKTGIAITGPVTVASNEATVFVDAPAPARAVQDVRDELKLAVRHYGMAECPYVGG